MYGFAYFNKTYIYLKSINYFSLSSGTFKLVTVKNIAIQTQ